MASQDKKDICETNEVEDVLEKTCSYCQSFICSKRIDGEIYRDYDGIGFKLSKGVEYYHYGCYSMVDVYVHEMFSYFMCNDLLKNNKYAFCFDYKAAQAWDPTMGNYCTFANAPIIFRTRWMSAFKVIIIPEKRIPYDETAKEFLIRIADEYWGKKF